MQEGRKAGKPLTANQKASNRERNGSKPDILPLSLPITGAGGSHYPASLKGCSNTKEKVLHFRVHISSSMLAVPASDLGLTVWICDPEFLPPFHIRFVCVSLVGYYIGHPSLRRNTQKVRHSSPRPRIISTYKRPSRSSPTDLHFQFPYSARHHHISMPRFRMPPHNRLAAVVKLGKCTHLKDSPLHSNCLLSILSRAFSIAKPRSQEFQGRSSTSRNRNQNKYSEVAI